MNRASSSMRRPPKGPAAVGGRTLLPHSASGPSGVALVLVLLFLVIISGVVAAFFSSVTTESSAAKSYSAETSSRLLSEVALNLVEAQLADATRGQTDSSSSGTPLAWASRPGMISTFDAQGSPQKLYKLYSADDLVVDSSAFGNDADVAPATWASSPDIYTDLNSPEVGSDKTLIYPIVDPTAVNLVDGFSIVLPSGYAETNSSLSPSNPAPMPVKWLYVLRDGTLAAAGAATGDPGAVTVTLATAANPVIGRIAFWADDESGKVNINTASEGTYWDVPRIYSQEDMGRFQGSSYTVAVPGLSICQPAQHEYQRYPGHPATTSLSPVLHSFMPAPLQPIDGAGAALATAQLATYYAITPRVLGGGSQAGTQMPPGPIDTSRKQDRLYASLDELMFTPALAASRERVPNTASAGSTAPNLLTREALEKVKFFLTANSNAPETTLYNSPRIAMWPIHTNTAQQTAFDKLIAFCSTIGKQPYYFTRTNARSGSQDYTGSPRNQALYKYLQAETAQPVPGFGGAFSTKYAGGKLASERDQILTSIYDWIRCVNLSDSSTPGLVPYTPLFNANANGNSLGTDGPNIFPFGAGEVVPIHINNTRGFGRIYTVSEADVIFYGTHATTGQTDKLKAVFLLEFASPMEGLGAMRSTLKCDVSGLDGFKISPDGGAPRPLGFPIRAVNLIENTDLQTFHGRSIGGTEGPLQSLSNQWNNTKQLLVAGAVEKIGNYPFFTQNDFTFTPPPKGPYHFAFQGGTVTVKLLTQDTGELVQTISLTFPNGDFKTPDVSGLSNFNDRISGPNASGVGTLQLVQPQDTVIGLEPAGAKGNDPAPAPDHTAGDTRLLAALQDVPATMFRAHADYGKAQQQFAHGLTNGVGTGYSGSTFGKLVNVPSYMGGGLRNPDVPSRAGNFVARTDGRPGDWDTGIGDQKDGAYIGKPDEGDANFTNSRVPYLLGGFAEFAPPGQTYFSPNRLIPSPLMLGSIPTGVQRLLPWQTLLFHKRPEDPAHPGNVSPPDHLLADLFWMPVVEPYAISQPFATAGKINLNYQIEPFTYLHRDTALRAALKSTRFMALQLADGSTYKPIDPGASPFTIGNRRQSLDLNATLAAFDKRFTKQGIFRSASQICEMNLVPEGQQDSSMASFWLQNQLTGDNLREKPYADLYSRLTTKSNTYTVHFRAQALQKASDTPPASWVHSRDQVLGEYRGSSIIERYIDVNDPRLPDFATQFASAQTAPGAATNIDQYYKMRVVSTKRFAVY